MLHTQSTRFSTPSFLVTIIAGMVASAFFSLTFVVNQALGLAHDSWQWTAALRYFFMVPLLWGLLYLTPRSRRRLFWIALSEHPWRWIGGGTIGFGLFYAPLTIAAQYGPAWLVAGTWQLTIIMGGLLEPVVKRTRIHARSLSQGIPWRTLFNSMVILAGVSLLQWDHFRHLSSWHNTANVVGPIILAAVAYPLGNRMMITYAPQMSATERTLGMTLGSLPFWGTVAFWGLMERGWPQEPQIIQSVIVAIGSGVIATVLFYWATQHAFAHPEQLAAIEATQSGEVLFSLIGSMVFLGQSWPSPVSMGGVALIILGMILHSLQRKTTSTFSVKT
ncbi:DMT family transporter [Sulfobacillus thermosulfidooxidans]|uniref:DMT family transporter n=1 Tax=Sulfobacillus thermosulfidooxidans TaxID=28034 RepID=UPI0006B4D1C6|nr:multidrug resistance efflux transporter family protein [Sulfobacillus thermosulfidooxidans]